MAIIVEDGSAVAGAESYVDLTTADAYWLKRPHQSHSLSWSSASTEFKEGALREASAFVDSQFGAFYKGSRIGYVQGLLWPRTGALDEAGNELQNLPDALQDAVCELAVRAIQSPLAIDQDRSGEIKKIRNKVDVIEEEIEYESGAGQQPAYGIVAGLLTPLLDGTQPGSSASAWSWS